MENYKDKLDKIEQEVNNAKIEKAKLEERKRNLEEEYTKIVEELKKEGITIEDLENNINELEIGIQEGIAKCQQILK